MLTIALLSTFAPASGVLRGDKSRFQLFGDTGMFKFASLQLLVLFFFSDDSHF